MVNQPVHLCGPTRLPISPFSDRTYMSLTLKFAFICTRRRARQVLRYYFPTFDRPNALQFSADVDDQMFIPFEFSVYFDDQIVETG